jgi:hypothetical protein
MASIKKEFTTFIIALQLLIIGYYGISLIISSLILNQAIFYQDLNLIITSSSWVPIIKLVNTLLDVQVFNQVGIIEIISASLLLIKGLTIIDMIFMINSLIILYIFLFKTENNRFYKVGALSTIVFIGLALVLLLASIFTALNTLLFSNNNPINVLPTFSMIFLIFGIGSLLVGIGLNLLYFISKYALKNKIFFE